ncbi:MAG: hypothetical protein JOZ96_02045 [Acidobacteria bacterium]|nr:hypothetical protein [Acidobacteriota bacterium]
MPTANKVLWTVGLGNLDRFVNRARSIGASAVAIRTSNSAASFAGAIRAFHELNIKVYGWRWPPINRRAALGQANQVVELMRQGLDGFIVDPEADKDQKNNFWDKAELAGLAEEFCSTIRDAFPDRHFGTTSHYRAKRSFPNLPWKAFFRHSDKTYPQAYWRNEQGRIGQGVRSNYNVSLSAWAEAGANAKTIVPMAGEIALATAAEIRTHAAVAAENGIDELHFYTTTPGVTEEVWRAIAEA